MSLNIYVDETGDFGFSKNSSLVYGVSFVLQEEKNSIKSSLKGLNERLKRIGYKEMIHTANLISNRGEYKEISLEKRKSIFNAIYYFSLEINVKYKSIFIDKRYLNNKYQLKTKLEKEMQKFISENNNYFNKFKKINLYYDNGQKKLAKALEEVFGKIEGYNHITEFDHTKERLFQVADMLTYIDKSYYCKLHKIKNNGNPYFFTLEEFKNIIKNIDKKRI